MPKLDKPKRKKVLSRKLRKQNNQSKQDALALEIAALEKRIHDEAPPPGSNPLAYDAFAKKPEDGVADDGAIQYPAAKKFVHFPLSQATQDALAKNNFIRLTDIQRAALPHALVGRDVLGAAKTGSGKTLAFSIPLIEKLFRLRWNAYDGVGALVISPTRELAMQIFEVLRKVGSLHDLSAGLLIGGKSFDEEAKRLLSMNILVCTPGRLLQHMDQTPSFNCDNLQVLVLDEADRILDLGFEATLTSIVQNLPESRQTLLFSATQTKSVKQLAKLSLKNPEYVAVHEAASEATPSKLVQTYMMIEAHQKFDVLFSFIRTHLKSKCIVFLSSCKQVRFMFEVYRKMHPGVPLMEINGKMKQAKRMAIYYDFIEKPAAVLFSTDVAARGLDFPGVDWVVQFDCPDSVASYIHRVGRTARYKSAGNGLLLLLPSESAMVDQLEAQKIPIKKVKANPEKLQSVTAQFAAILAADPDVKYLAQKSFVTYMRSVFLQSDKTVFDVTKIDAAKLAEAMGLPGTPKLKFAKGSAHGDKNLPAALRGMLEEERLKEAAKAGDKEAAAKYQMLLEEKKKRKDGDDVQMRRIEKLLHRGSSSVYSQAHLKLREDEDDDEDDDEDSSSSDDDDQDEEAESKSKQNKKTQSADSDDDDDEEDVDADLFRVKRRDHELVDHEAVATGKKSRMQIKLERLKAKGMLPAHLANDDEYEVEDESVAAPATAIDRQKRLQSVSSKMKAADVEDKLHEHERVRELHKKQKLKEKEMNQRQVQGGQVAVLGDPDDNDEDDEDEDEDEEDEDEDEEEIEDEDEEQLDIDLNESDDDDDDDFPASKKASSSIAPSSKRKAPVDSSSDDSDDDEDEVASAKPTDSKKSKHVDSKSLQDSEQLALKILQARRK